MIYGNYFLKESMLKDSEDIYYNKDKFNSGEVNLCFITGASGSGKSTMAHKLESKDIEVYELDDVVWNKMKFTMDNFKEYGDLIYSFFKGPGKKFYLGEGEKYSGDNYERDVIQSFVKYAISYANSHKDKKFILEGVWIAYDDHIQPQELKDYAVFIKGTSSLKSTMRGIKRDHSDDTSSKFTRTVRDVKSLIKRAKYWVENEKSLNKWRKYYGNKSE